MPENVALKRTRAIINYLKILLSILGVLFITSCSGQKEMPLYKFQIIELPDYYDGKGAIIPANSAPFFLGTQNKFTPSIEQLKVAEQILQDDLYNHLERWFNNGKFFPTPQETLKEVKEHFADDLKRVKKYYRYYIGYITENNEEVIVAVCFNFSTSEARREFDNWENDFSYNTSDFYYSNTRIYHINLTRRVILDK